MNIALVYLILIKQMAYILLFSIYNIKDNLMNFVYLKLIINCVYNENIGNK